MKKIILLFCLVFSFSTNIFSKPIIPKNNKLILGFHTGWAQDSISNYYNWDALDILVYYGYEVDYLTGNPKKTYNWNNSFVIDSAHSNNVHTQLLVALMNGSEIHKLLQNNEAVDNLINQVIYYVKKRNSNGICIDFENISVMQKENFILFLHKLRSKMDSLIGNESILSIAVPAVDWYNSLDYISISKIVDYIMLMAYDYSYSSSANAGAVAPLEGTNYNVKKSINNLLTNGCPANKLLLGVPWYAYLYKVENEEWGSKTIGKGTALTYSKIKSIININQAEFDNVTKTKRIKYSENNEFYQLWFDDSLTLSLKYELVNTYNLEGIGIWAINYAGKEQELFLGILDMFQNKNYYSENINKLKLNKLNKKLYYHLPNIKEVKIFDILANDISHNFIINIYEQYIELSNQENIVIIQFIDYNNDIFVTKILNK